MSLQIDTTKTAVPYDIFKGIGIEVTFTERSMFPQIRETLTRVGNVSSASPFTLVQSCYLFHKQGRYVIAHYKELRKFDGEDIEVTDADIGQRNAIAAFLESPCNLLTVLERDDLEHMVKNYRVIQHADKFRWRLLSPYHIGGISNKKKEETLETV